MFEKMNLIYQQQQTHKYLIGSLSIHVFKVKN